MNSEQAKSLLSRYAEGTCSPEESAQVEAWYHRVAKQQGDPTSDTDYAVDYMQALERLQQSLPSSQSQRRSKRLVHWLPYAAAALIVATAAVWMFFGEHGENRQATTIVVEDIPPGGNRATLTLADGRKIALDEARNGIVIGSGEITYNDGNPLAEVSGNEGGQEKIPLSELSTPKGGTYQIVLPDGTKVWLNAASTLKYPSRFDGDERVIELSGEAYFAVAKDVKKPFKVVSNGQEIQVLGTEFNISAYVDEVETKTTLVKGAVQIINYQSSMVNRLKPGEQSIIRGTSTDIQKVDTERYIAWKNGYFYFKQTPFEEIMRQLARWYDVEVVYKGGIPRETFSGEMDRNLTLSGVLKLLNVFSVQVQIEEGGKLVVY